MKLGLNSDELRQLAQDLKAGKTWDEVKRTRLAGLAPGVLEASDYQAWAHREAGIEMPAAAPADPPPPAPEPEPEAEEESGDHRRGRGRGR